MNDNEKSCAPTSCSTEKSGCMKKFLLAAIVTFVITMAFDWLVHGKLLMGQYLATASLWRPQAEMETMMSYCLGKHALQALVFAAIFMCWKKSQTFGALCTSQCPLRKGFFFGGKIGLLMGINAAAAYIYMPIPQDLALAWLVTETVKWGLTAGILAWMCQSCSKK